MEYKDKQYDYIICGSGFGGSVSALRLVEKGYKVLLIEKGRRYQTKDFPKTNWNLKKSIWFPSLYLYGIQCITFLKHVFILHGTGYGGGSLVYANTLLVPKDEAFIENSWTDKKWKQRLLPYYDIAKKMLGATKAKAIGESDTILREIAREMDKSDTFSEVDVGVYFSNSDKSIDPYFDGQGPLRSGCKLCGECMTGCRHNAKNTLDKNYLFFAEKLGIDILTEHEVMDINTTQAGYKLKIKKSTGLIRKSYFVKSTKVILSGGVMGTVKLLLKCKQNGSLPKLSQKLGDFVRTNSESILTVRSYDLDKNQDMNKGLAISSGFSPDTSTHIETCRYGKGQNLLSILTTQLISKKGVINWLFNILTHPIKFLKYSIPKNWSSQTIILLIMQPINNYLKLSYNSSFLNPFTSNMSSSLSADNPIPSSIPEGERVAKKVADKINGTIMTSYMDSFFSIPTTAHVLGGACMGKTIEDGVVDENLEVFNYPGLYVIDGSAVPGNLGVNPSLTITALAEYALSNIDKK
tara:strand:- start:583 stop:2148 length:1566 start_codon:yes stop_codon:yes gene_type:complete